MADIPSEAHDIGLFEPTFQSVTTSYHWTFILWIYTFYTLAMGPQNPGVAPKAAIFQWELTHLHNTVATCSVDATTLKRQEQSEVVQKGKMFQAGQLLARCSPQIQLL